MKNTYTFIDLFSGCGGLSEGFNMQGLHGLAHVEWETPMVDTLRNRLVKAWNHSESEAEAAVVHFDIQKTDELISGNWSDETIELYGKTNAAVVAQQGLDGLVGSRKVDLIIGGPPCQGFSLSGPRNFNDPRNKLYLSYIRLVEEIKPRAFVVENVPGLVGLFNGEVKELYNACRWSKSNRFVYAKDVCVKRV